MATGIFDKFLLITTEVDHDVPATNIANES